jgi:cytoskeletal protein CcmA (bactofilin family)
MAELKYLAHINLNENQLQNAAMQILSSDPSGFEGHLYYNSSSNVLKFHNGSGYVALSSASGDITGVTLSGDSGSASDTSANVDLTIAGGTGITTSATGTTVTATIDAAQTGITSLLATDIKIGEDDQTKIDFETANEIHFYANNVEQVYLGDNIFGPQSDSDVDLGSSSVRWKDAYVDSITVTGEVDGASLDISGDADIDGTLEADAITVGGTALNTVIAGVTVANATTAAVATTVTITDNENTNEENALVFTAGGDIDGGNLGLEADGNATYNPSTGTITATIFKGNIDAVDGDFDGTLEADAITIGGTNLLTDAMEFSGNTVFSGTPSITGTLNVAANIVHTGDTNTLIGFTTDAIKMQTGGTARIDVSDSGVRFGGTGARITQVEDNDSLGTSDTKLATQGNVKAYVDARVGTNITSLGTIAQDTVTFSSSNANDPLVVIKNTTNDANGARLQFVKDKGAAGADNDEIGEILFTGDDAAQAQTDFGKMLVNIGEADNTDEAGIMTLQVAASDGTTTGLVSGLVLTGHKTSNYVDVTLGSGSSSTVTIPGNLTVSGTTTTVNSTTVNLNDHNIVLDSGNSTSAVVNGAGITIEGGSGDDAKINYSTTGPKFELLLGSSYEDLQVAQLIASSLDISGNVDVDGTLETDALTVDGTAIADLIAATTVTNANHILITDNENTNEENQITFIEGAGGGGALRGLEADGDFTYNPSTGTVSATVFKGNIDAVNGDFDGTLEADAITVNGTALAEVIADTAGAMFSSNTETNVTVTYQDSDNTIDVVVADAADDTKGVVELATTAEALAGSDTSRAVTAAGLAARSFTTTIGDGSDDDIAVTHSLGTRNVVVQLFDSSSYETIIAEVVRTDANTVTINTNAGSTIATNDVTVLVTKID